MLLRRATTRAAGCVFAMGLFTGCVSNSQGEAMRAQLGEHEQLIQELQEARQAQLEQLQQAEARAEDKIEQLEGVIDRATSVVKRNSADVTVTVSEMQTQIEELQGRIAELSYALDQANSASASSPESSNVEPEQVPEDPQAHYTLGYDAFKAKEYERARSLFRLYVERYPEDKKADNAQYWIGASYLVERRPASALSELRKVIQLYRSGDAVDPALLDMSEAFFRLGACEDARKTLAVLLQSNPNASLKATARDKQKLLRNPPAGKCKD